MLCLAELSLARLGIFEFRGGYNNHSLLHTTKLKKRKVLIMETNSKKKDNFLKAIIHMNFGEIFLHKDIETLIGEKYQTQEYFAIINSAKKQLTKYGKVIESVRGQGYRVIEPDEYTDISLQHYKRASKEIKKGYNILENAPTKDMSKEGLQRFRHIADRSRVLNAMAAGTMKELKILNEKSKLLLSEGE
jgi:DNA-binding winged helix-turn-helix (wHTH) protein